MELQVEVEGLDRPQVLSCHGEEHEPVHVIIGRAIMALDVDHDRVVEFIEQDEIVIDTKVLARDLPHLRLRAYLARVEVHFEGESTRHAFPARAPWAVVHRWACKKFDIAHDACPNLVLHEGSPTGKVLNERLPIGRSQECLSVWLVKPGPEPFGRVPTQ